MQPIKILGNLRNPLRTILKQEAKKIDPLDFEEVIILCKQLDIPFLIEEYLRDYKMTERRFYLGKSNYPYSLLKWIAKMNLLAYRNYTFSDSIELNHRWMDKNSGQN